MFAFQGLAKISVSFVNRQRNNIYKSILDLNFK